ncbi:MAG: hypothetical protein H7Y38_18425 [Armatimonadetes bacterium]|nr:hypothetical protein [Armatimonadota bacterium]
MYLHRLGAFRLSILRIRRFMGDEGEPVGRCAVPSFTAYPYPQDTQAECPQPVDGTSPHHRRWNAIVPKKVY